MVKVRGPGKAKEPSPEPTGRLGKHTVKPIKSRSGIFGWITHLFNRFLSIFRKSPPPPPGSPPGAPPPDVSHDPSLKTPPSTPETSLDPSRRETPPSSSRVTRAATPSPHETNWSKLIEDAQYKKYLPFIEACRNQPQEGKKAAKEKLEETLRTVLQTKDQKSLQKLAKESKHAAEKREELERQRGTLRNSLEKEVRTINQLSENVERYKRGKAPIDEFLKKESPEKKITDLIEKSSKSIPELHAQLKAKEQELSRQTFVSTKKKTLSAEIDTLKKAIVIAESELHDAQVMRKKRVEQERARDEWQEKIDQCHATMQPLLERQSKVIEEDQKIQSELEKLERLENTALQLGKVDAEQTEALFFAWALNELAMFHVKLTDTPRQIWHAFSQRQDLGKNFKAYLRERCLTPADNLPQLIHNLLLIAS